MTCNGQVKWKNYLLSVANRALADATSAASMPADPVQYEFLMKARQHL